ncbi:MAG: DoxX family protein [Bacteroidales bacterium]|nr:DoxX family protein [Bacteroidales bacterium]
MTIKTPHINTEQLIQPEKGRGFQIVGWVLRILFGAVFIFSGFVKAIDPLGSQYKITDYLTAMGLEQFAGLALVAAICLSALELAIGLSMTTGIKVKLAGILGLLFMLIMTPLTLWIALKNPVSDCGCFGDAVTLSNWATFWKNIVLLIVIIVIIYCNKYERPYLKPFASSMVAICFFLLGVLISCISLRHLPCIDFRPYKVGNYLPELMEVPEEAEIDQYKTTFIYEKDGVQQEFDETNYPWNDSTWTFVDQTSVLVKKGYVPPIHDFNLVTLDGDEITDIVLEADHAYLVVMYDLSKTNRKYLNKVLELYQQAQQESAQFYALTASLEDDIYAIAEEAGIPSECFCQCDPITLKTIVRANPGFVELKQGTVVAKWNAADYKVNQQ